MIQYNKRDVADPVPLDEMKRILNPEGVPDYEAIAVKGDGVFETLKTVVKLVLAELKKGT